ncbi:putative nuclease HARBI1 [Ixodes scapularis]|uniref:putative nuclease HARBI1 n=1 Tax=Ixodes scapularis TaxID=6945 RepID=UPI001A9DA3C1|nr:putative nuclease HARBI1 [Ixodes scapularis]
MRLDDGEDFLQYFRMTRQRFDHLLSLVGPLLQKKTTFWRKPISPAERLSLTIRYLAHGGSQVICGSSYRIGRTTASEIIQETCQALRKVLEPLYRPAPNTAQWERIAAEFERQWNFPNCVGALDGKHVAIQAPPGAGSDTYNYKGFHSIVLMASCDANYKFTLVDVGKPGRYSDGGVFRDSDMGDAILSGTAGLPPPGPLPGTRTKLPFVFVGDEAFPLLTNLMRPFPLKSLKLLQKVFNYRLSRARRVIENTFWILVARWRISRQPIQACPATLEAVVWACVSLHNYLRVCDEAERGERLYCPAGYVDSEGYLGETVRGQCHTDSSDGSALSDVGQLSSNMHASDAKGIRHKFAKFFCTRLGEVSWQYRVVFRGAAPVNH